MKESLLLSESERVRQNNLDSNKKCFSERSLSDQSVHTQNSEFFK